MEKVISQLKLNFVKTFATLNYCVKLEWQCSVYFQYITVHSRLLVAVRKGPRDKSQVFMSF